MTDIKWHFREKKRDEMNQDFQLGEFFASEEDISDRLVREVIQNSLDASSARKFSGNRTVEEPVRVRFSLHGLANPLPTHRANAYFQGLSDHLQDIEGLDDNVRQLAKQGTLLEHCVPFILIEDSGTTGLRGNPEQHKDESSESDETNDFYWFFRNVGRSGKGATDNGSWGLGKWVFPDASGASAFLALTTTDEDTLLMGHTVLKEHHVGGKKYAPYGYWSVPDGDGFAMPLQLTNAQHRPLIERFMSDFGLEMRDNPGLSVVIPFPRPTSSEPSGQGEVIEHGTNARALVRAVVHNYFYPIMRGWLEVTIEDPNTFPVEIKRSNIGKVVAGIEADGAGQWSTDSYRRVFKMVTDVAQMPDDRFIELSQPPTQGDDYVDAGKLSGLREQYEKGELLSFRIHSKVRPKSENEVDTKFEVYLRHVPELETGHDYFIRGTLSIPKMDYIKSHKALALIVVDENEPLAQMLQDSEPPAHTVWRPQAQRVRDRWVSPQRRINAVRDTVKNILWHLEGQPSGLQKDAFLDLFRIDGLQNAAATGNGASGGSQSGGGGSPPQSTPSPFTVSETRGGVSIQTSRQADEIPDQVIIRLAYDVPRGNAFKKYNESDFAFRSKDGLRVNLIGGEIEHGEQEHPIDANAVQLRVKDRDKFSFKVTGFDEFRDVVVRIDQPTEAN